MTVQNPPRGYTAAQIVLHWMIALLIVFQIEFGKDIVPVMRRASEVSPSDLFSANLHIYVGFTILVLAAARFAIRLIHGAPPAPAGQGAVQTWIAAATNFIVCAMNFVMRVTGSLAWYLGVGAVGEVHDIAKPVVIIAVLLQVAAALWRHLVAKAHLLMKGLRPTVPQAT